MDFPPFFGPFLIFALRAKLETSHIPDQNRLPFMSRPSFTSRIPSRCSFMRPSPIAMAICSRGLSRAVASPWNVAKLAIAFGIRNTSRTWARGEPHYAE